MEKASKLHKPMLIFRVFDCEDDYDDALAKQNYAVMMQPRDDQVKGIRTAINELFNLPDCKIIWTETLSKTEKKLLDDGKIEEFMKVADHFTDACVKLTDVINSVPFRGVCTKILLEKALEINKQSATIHSSEFDQASQMNERDIRWWLEGDKYGKHENKVSQVPMEFKSYLPVQSCNQNEEDLLNDRNIRINNLIDEFQLRFSKSPVFLKEAGLKELKSMIEKPYLEAKSNFDKLYAEFYKGTIYIDVQQYLDNKLITNQDMCDANKVNNYFADLLKFIDSKNYPIGTSCKKKLYGTTIANNNYAKKSFAEEAQKYTNLLNGKMDKIKATLDFEIKNPAQVLGKYIDKLEMEYSDILNEIMNERNKILQAESIWKSSINICKKYMGLPVEKKQNTRVEVGVKTYTLSEYFDMDTEYFYMDTNLSLIKEETQWIETNEENVIADLIDKLVTSLVNFEPIFKQNRADLIPKLLSEYNKLPYYERLNKYREIKHNDLYMCSFALKIDGSLLDYQVFRDKLSENAYDLFVETKENLYIHTRPTFEKTYTPKFIKAYETIQANENPTLTNWLKYKIYDLWCEETYM